MENLVKMLKSYKKTDNLLTNSCKNGTIVVLKYEKGLDSYDDKK